MSTARTREEVSRFRGIRRDVSLAIRICRHERAPWYARLIAACCIGYVFSPVQIIPDFVPVLGLLDDLVIVSLGLALLLKLTPPEVIAECREREAASIGDGLSRPRRVAAALVVSLWVLLAVGGAALAMRVFRL